MKKPPKPRQDSLHSMDHPQPPPLPCLPVVEERDVSPIPPFEYVDKESFPRLALLGLLFLEFLRLDHVAKGKMEAKEEIKKERLVVLVLVPGGRSFRSWWAAVPGLLVRQG